MIHPYLHKEACTKLAILVTDNHDGKIETTLVFASNTVAGHYWLGKMETCWLQNRNVQ